MKLTKKAFILSILAFYIYCGESESITINQISKPSDEKCYFINDGINRFTLTIQSNDLKGKNDIALIITGNYKISEQVDFEAVCDKFNYLNSSETVEIKCTNKNDISIPSNAQITLSSIKDDKGNSYTFSLGTGNNLSGPNFNCGDLTLKAKSVLFYGCTQNNYREFLLPVEISNRKGKIGELSGVLYKVLDGNKKGEYDFNCKSTFVQEKGLTGILCELPTSTKIGDKFYVKSLKGISMEETAAMEIFEEDCIIQKQFTFSSWTQEPSCSNGQNEFILKVDYNKIAFPQEDNIETFEGKLKDNSGDEEDFFTVICEGNFKNDVDYTTVVCKYNEIISGNKQYKLSSIENSLNSNSKITIGDNAKTLKSFKSCTGYKTEEITDITNNCEIGAYLATLNIKITFKNIANSNTKITIYIKGNSTETGNKFVAICDSITPELKKEYNLNCKIDTNIYKISNTDIPNIIDVIDTISTKYTFKSSLSQTCQTLNSYVESLKAQSCNYYTPSFLMTIYLYNREGSGYIEGQLTNVDNAGDVLDFKSEYQASIKKKTKIELTYYVSTGSNFVGGTYYLSKLFNSKQSYDKKLTVKLQNCAESKTLNKELTFTDMSGKFIGGIFYINFLMKYNKYAYFEEGADELFKGKLIDSESNYYNYTCNKIKLSYNTEQPVQINCIFDEEKAFLSYNKKVFKFYSLQNEDENSIDFSSIEEKEIIISELNGEINSIKPEIILCPMQNTLSAGKIDLNVNIKNSNDLTIKSTNIYISLSGDNNTYNLYCPKTSSSFIVGNDLLYTCFTKEEIKGYDMLKINYIKDENNNMFTTKESQLFSICLNSKIEIGNSNTGMKISNCDSTTKRAIFNLPLIYSNLEGNTGIVNGLIKNNEKSYIKFKCNNKTIITNEITELNCYVTESLYSDNTNIVYYLAHDISWELLKETETNKELTFDGIKSCELKIITLKSLVKDNELACDFNYFYITLNLDYKLQNGDDTEFDILNSISDVLSLTINKNNKDAKITCKQSEFVYETSLRNRRALKELSSISYCQIPRNVLEESFTKFTIKSITNYNEINIEIDSKYSNLEFDIKSDCKTGKIAKIFYNYKCGENETVLSFYGRLSDISYESQKDIDFTMTLNNERDVNVNCKLTPKYNSSKFYCEFDEPEKIGDYSDDDDGYIIIKECKANDYLLYLEYSTYISNFGDDCIEKSSSFGLNVSFILMSIIFIINLF